jgi:hypothetical protein
MTKLKWYKSWEMRMGGNQLAELISKDFPHTYLKQHQRELGLSNHDLSILQVWIDCEFSLRKTLQDLHQITQRTYRLHSITRLFLHAGSLFYKLLKRIDITPQFDAKGRLLKRYSFLNYDEYQVEDSVYRVVEVSLNKQRFWRSHVRDIDERKYYRVAVYRMYKDRWNKTQTKFAREYLEAYKMMKRMMNE